MPKVGTLVFTLSTADSTSTTYDATITGLGDVTAFFYIQNCQDLDGTEHLERYHVMGLGAIDSGGAFDCHSSTARDIHNVTTQDSYRDLRYLGDNTIRMWHLGEYTVARITDGIRLTKTGTADASADREYQIIFTVFSDCKAAVGSGTLPNSTTTSITTNASDGSGNIDCNVALFQSACQNATNNGNNNIALPSYGWGQRITDSTFRQWGHCWHSQDGQTTMRMTSQFCDDNVLTQTSAGAENWGAALTNWTANGSTSAIQLTTNASTGADYYCYLALEDTVSAYVDYKTIESASTSHTLTGSTTSGVSAKCLFVGGSTNDTVNAVDTTTEATGDFMAWISDKSSGITEGSSYGISADGVGTSYCKSYNNDSNGFIVKAYVGGETTRAVGTLEFDGQDATATYTTTPPSASYNVNYGYALFSDDWAGGGGSSRQVGLQDLSTGFIPSFSQIQVGLR